MRYLWSFLALLYLSFVRRAEPVAGALSSARGVRCILLFLPVVFFEPLQRVMEGFCAGPRKRKWIARKD